MTDCNNLANLDRVYTTQGKFCCHTKWCVYDCRWKLDWLLLLCLGNGFLHFFCLTSFIYGLKLSGLDKILWRVVAFLFLLKILTDAGYYYKCAYVKIFNVYLMIWNKNSNVNNIRFLWWFENTTFPIRIKSWQVMFTTLTHILLLLLTEPKLHRRDWFVIVQRIGNRCLFYVK